MKIQILTKQIKSSPELESIIEKKVGALEKYILRLERKGEIIVDIEVARTTEHHRHGNIFYAEATMQLPHKILRAEENADTIESAIDGMKDKLKMEIMKYRELHILRNKRTI